MCKDIFVESLPYCQKEKGLRLYAWVIMSKGFTSSPVLKEELCWQILFVTLRSLPVNRLNKQLGKILLKAGKSVSLACPAFPARCKRAGQRNSNNKNFQFGNRIITHSSYMVKRCCNKSCCTCMRIRFVQASFMRQGATTQQRS